MSTAGLGCLGACHIDIGVINWVNYESTTPECTTTTFTTTNANTTTKVFVLSDKKNVIVRMKLFRLKFSFYFVLLCV